MSAISAQGLPPRNSLRDTGTGERPTALAVLYRDFLAAHDRVYGYAAKSPARIVNLRTVHRVLLPAPALPCRRNETGTSQVRRATAVLIDPARGIETAIVHDRAALAPGAEFAGPAIVEQPDTTTLVPAGWRCRVDAAANLILEPVA